jgi:hypothetical protein
VPKFTSAWSARSSDDDHNSRWHIFPVEWDQILTAQRSTVTQLRNNCLIWFLFFSWWHRLLDPLDVEEAFEFMNDLGDPCRRKILCHVHSFVPYAPAWLQTVVRVIRSLSAERWANLRLIL